MDRRLRELSGLFMESLGRGAFDFFVRPESAEPFDLNNPYRFAGEVFPVFEL
jgi:hypothetical protein